MKRESITKVSPDLKIFNTTQLNRILKRENRKYSDKLIELPRDQWQPNMQKSKVKEAWRSNRYLVQIYHENGDIERLSICRTRLNSEGHYEDNISWDDLQRLKSECGRGDKMAVEVFPADSDIVNVANMRHLWVLPENLPFVWKNKTD